MKSELFNREAKMRSYINLLLITVLFSATTFCSWELAFGGSDIDMGRCVVETDDGGYILTGTTESFGAGDKDVYVIKVNQFGETTWMRTFGGEYDDEGYCVIEAADGGYIVAGVTESFGEGGDIYLIKLDSFGDSIWTKTYGGSNYEKATSVVQTSNKELIVAGCTYSFGAGGSDIYVLKLTSMGDTIWTRTCGGAFDDFGYSVSLTADNKYIVTGSSKPTSSGRPDVYIQKLDAAGETVWTRTYGGSYYDIGYGCASTSDGGCIVAGATSSFGTGSQYDAYILRLTSSGDTLWTRRYGGSASEKAYSVVQTHDGGYIVVGETQSYGAGAYDIYTLGLFSTGDTLWTSTSGGTSSDRAYSIALTSDGGYAIAGYTQSFGAGSYDVYFAKIDYYSFMPVCESGFSRQDEPTFSAYPNPFNSSVAISFGADSDIAPSRVEVYDVDGRIVEEIPVSTHGTGIFAGGDFSGACRWSPASSIASGVYFIRAIFGDKSVSEQVVYLK